MLLEGNLELCQQDEQRLVREGKGLEQIKHITRERHDLQQRLKLEQRIRLEHPPDAPMKVELLRYPSTSLRTENWRQQFNADEEVWAVRLGSRLAGVAVMKHTKEYLTPWYVTKTPAPPLQMLMIAPALSALGRSGWRSGGRLWLHKHAPATTSSSRSSGKLAGTACELASGRR